MLEKMTEKNNGLYDYEEVRQINETLRMPYPLGTREAAFGSEFESYGGILEGISVIFAAVNEIDGYPVNAVFDSSDLPDFRLSEPENCPDCKNGIKLDAIVNSYGYTKLD